MQKSYNSSDFKPQPYFLLHLWCVEDTADLGDSRPLLPLLLEIAPPPLSLYISTLPG